MMVDGCCEMVTSVQLPSVASYGDNFFFLAMRIFEAPLPDNVSLPAGIDLEIVTQFKTGINRTNTIYH